MIFHTPLHRTRRILCIILSIPFFVACKALPSNLSPVDVAQPTANPTSPANPITSSVPATTTSPLPAPSVLKGTVVGQLFNRNGEPITGTAIYLARVYKSNDQTKGVFALDPTRAPKTVAMEAGDFTFTNIEPGDYVLVIGNPDGSKNPAIYSDDRGQAEVFTAKVGEITNLGNIRITY